MGFQLFLQFFFPVVPLIFWKDVGWTMLEKGEERVGMLNLEKGDAGWSGVLFAVAPVVPL
jgi:hypothetical protein